MNYNIINFSLSIIYFIISVSVVSAAVIQKNSNDIDSAIMYLSRFGYIDHSAINSPIEGLVSKWSVKDAIMEFQAFAGLSQTGILDEQTLEMMNTPRCGVVDKMGYGSSVRRKKRNASQVMNKWNKLDLTYKIRNYPETLTKDEVDREIDRAFKVWSNVIDLTFTAVRTGQVDIDIRFVLGEHGDEGPFDGPGGVIAHAFLPFCWGDAHFDNSETWTIDSNKGINLFENAVHEFGHSLGLYHSDVLSAIMSPFYIRSQRKISLHNDDIRAIKSLYGEKTVRDKTHSPSKPKVRSKPTESDSILCRDGSIDAIVTMEDNKTYVFKGENLWMLNDEGIEKGYPKSISKEFPGLLPYIDAAFTWTNGKTYFFKESMYWRFSGHTMDDNYPRKISEGFSGIPNNIDAAFYWSGNGDFYLFKESMYWTFSSHTMSGNYPSEISKGFSGMPNNIDAAFVWSGNGKIYFFKDGKYWLFNDPRFQVELADPPYPRQAGPWWFGCPGKDSHKVTPGPDKKINSSNESEYDVINTDNYEDYYSFYDDSIHH